MKKVIILRSNPINPDPRVEKILDILKDHYNIKIICWDREKKYNKIEIIQNNVIIERIKIKGKYGTGLKNLLSLLNWFFYLFLYLYKNNFDIIHACDFDTFFPAFFVSKLKHKKIIYDIFDFYSDMIRKIPKFLKNIISKIDKFMMKFADAVIIPDENRLKQIGFKNKDKITIVYNTPKDYYEIFKNKIDSTKYRDTFILGYIGLISEDRGINNIINVLNEIDNENIKFVIGGYGDKNLEKFLIETSNINKKIEFLGKVTPYLKTLEILSECDVMLAIYNPSNPNNKFASPNKIYEAMMLGKPIIVSKNTNVDLIVDKFKIGYSVNYDNLKELKDVITNLIQMKKTGKLYEFEKICRYTYTNFFSYDIIKKRLLDLYSKL